MTESLLEEIRGWGQRGRFSRDSILLFLWAGGKGRPLSLSLRVASSPCLSQLRTEPISSPWKACPCCLGGCTPAARRGMPLLCLVALSGVLWGRPEVPMVPGPGVEEKQGS